jgi:hypothetical protein
VRVEDAARRAISGGPHPRSLPPLVVPLPPLLRLVIESLLRKLVRLPRRGMLPACSACQISLATS